MKPIDPAKLPQLPSDATQGSKSICIEVIDGRVTIKMNGLPMFPQPIEDEVDYLISELTEIEHLRKIVDITKD